MCIKSYGCLRTLKLFDSYQTLFTPFFFFTAIMIAEPLYSLAPPSSMATLTRNSVTMATLIGSSMQRCQCREICSKIYFSSCNPTQLPWDFLKLRPEEVGSVFFYFLKQKEDTGNTNI